MIAREGVCDADVLPTGVAWSPNLCRGRRYGAQPMARRRRTNVSFRTQKSQDFIIVPAFLHFPIASRSGPAYAYDRCMGPWQSRNALPGLTRVAGMTSTRAYATAPGFQVAGFQCQCECQVP